MSHVLIHAAHIIPASQAACVHVRVHVMFVCVCVCQPGGKLLMLLTCHFNSTYICILVLLLFTWSHAAHNMHDVTLCFRKRQAWCVLHWHLYHHMADKEHVCFLSLRLSFNPVFMYLVSCERGEDSRSGRDGEKRECFNSSQLLQRPRASRG